MNQNISNLLKNCKKLESLKLIHAQLITHGSTSSSDLVLNKVLRLYSRFGATKYAHKVFNEFPEPNPFHYTSMIHGYVENSQHEDAFALFCRMRNSDALLLNFTITSVLKALGREKRLKDGEGLFGFVLKSGFVFDLLVENAVIDLFMKCGEVGSAKKVFDGMKEKDVVSWNSMISGYAKLGEVEVARMLFDEIPEDVRNVVSWTSIIHGYVKKGNIAEARRLFEAMPVKDLAIWNVMISGYVNCGDLDAARDLFERMETREVGTWNLMISGLCKVGEMEKAKEYFENMPRRNVATWSMMIDGYIKRGNLTEARGLFDQMPEKNLVSWSTMIGGYAKSGQPHAALELFECFKEHNIKPDETFILAIISTCSQLGIVDAAESVIGDHYASFPSENVNICTSLIDMYAKCGSIEKASQVFEMIDKKDLLCYSTMITAFANHGLVRDAISLFHCMLRENTKPDEVTFIGILAACNHGGLVDEGQGLFKLMTEDYKIQATEKHYACMVDLLGRAGRLEEAHNLILGMKVQPTSTVWGALLAACNVHGNVQLAEIAAAELFKIEPDNSGNYILLSNTYAAAGSWHDVAKIRGMIRENRVRKNRGSSWIELESKVHEFVTGDVLHVESDRIYIILDLLNEDMQFSEYA